MYNFDALKSELPHYLETLLYYKVNPCLSNQKNPIGELSIINQNCNQVNCYNYHSMNERRRPLFREDSSNVQYQPHKCPAVMGNFPCNQGDYCEFAHNQMEINFHPLYYKTEPCPGCPYEKNSKFCPYFHSDEVSRKITLEKFKAKLNKEALKTQQAQTPSVLTIFTLDNFKSKPCPLKGNHNPKMCEFYHHDQDRKRPVGVFHYSPNLCRLNTDDKVCPNGDNCRFAHNKVEQLYHPERYKKKFCLTHPQNVYKCDYGNYCSFAHSENEIQVELLHNIKKEENFYLYKYKTVFCPYIYDHDRNQCVYAHNPQDFRRDPKTFTYDPVQCSNWSQGQIFSYEEGGCPKLMQCEHCHGWKEMEYHPLYYKTKPCNNGKKCTKKDCPFFHNPQEQREIQFNQNLFSGQGQTSMMTPQKAATAFLENEYNLNLEIPKTRFVKVPKESYSQNRPVMPIMPNYAQAPKFNQQQEIFQAKPRRSGEPSTRPNSNISAVPFPSEEEHFRPQEKFKKKKTKGMSLQAKMDKSSSPLSAKSDKPKGQLFGKHQGKFSHQEWKPMDPEGHSSAFNEFFLAMETNEPLNESKADESFGSLESITLEKNVATSDKPNEAANAQFLKTLYSHLEKKGLDYAIQCFKNANVEVEILKSFSQKNFHLFPQIAPEDKEKIVKIVQDIEDEALFSEINTINDAIGGISLTQQKTEDINPFTNIGNDNNDFQTSSFFQKY